MSDSTPLSAHLSRFYALPVTETVADAIASDFANLDDDDLATAHLRWNRLYFGAIDKTLSGFVVLDDAGDDYTLLDLRGDGRIWWQDHETRELELSFAHLEDYRAFKAALAADEDADERSLLARFRPPAGEDGPLSSPALLRRWQWLAIALAQPTRDRDGTPMESASYLMRCAMNARSETFADTAAEQAALFAELPRLAQDPQLAAYWLLHTVVSGQSAWRDQVVAAIGRTEVPLLHDLLEAFAGLEDRDDLSVVPDFVERRALLQWMLASRSAPPDPVGLLRAVTMAPAALGETAGAKLAMLLSDDPAALPADATLQALAPLPADGAPAVLALRAQTLAIAGRPDEARTVAHAAAAALLASRLPPLPVLRLLLPIHRLVDDARTLGALAQRLLAWDDLMARVLEIAAHARALSSQAGLPDPAWLDRRHALAKALAGVLRAPDFAAACREAPPDVLDALALRLLRQPHLANDDAKLAWAFERLQAGDHPERWRTLCRACHTAPRPLRARLIAALAEGVDGPGHPQAPAMLALLQAAGTDDDGLADPAPSEPMIDAVIAALDPWFEDPRIFDPFIAMLEHGPGAGLLAARWESAYGREHGIATRLSAEQAERVFDWALGRLHAPHAGVPDHVAHRILGDTLHPGVWPRLGPEIARHSARLAAGDEQAVDALGALYALLGEAARRDDAQLELLIGRIWDEAAHPRAVIMRLKDVWSPELHADLLARLARRPEPAAAACYASVLDGMSRPGAPLVQLGQQVLDWPVPDAADARALLKYVLLAAAEQALRTHRIDELRALHARSEAIPGPARRPGRDGTYAPFDRPEARLALERALSEATPEALADGEAPTPDALARLARVAFAFEWLRDPDAGTVLFQDKDQGLHWFDGRRIATPPFAVDATPDKSDPGLFRDVQAVDERLLLWRDADTLYDWTRFGAVVAAAHGPNNGWQTRIALRFASEADAAALLERLRRNPPAGYRAGDPWYHAGHGSVARTLYVPGQSERFSLALSARQEWRAPDGELHRGEAAIVAMDALEAHVRRLGGFAYAIEALDTVLRPEDQSLADWLTDSAAPEGQPLAADVTAALHAIRDYLTAHRLLDDDGLRIDIAPAADATALDALQQASRTPLPETLVDAWRHSASVGWRMQQGHGLRLLSPAEVLAGGATMHGELRRPLLADDEGRPVLVLRDACEADGRQVVEADDPEGDDSWDTADADWRVRTTLLGALVRTLLDEAIADGRMLWYGQRGDAPVERLHLSGAEGFTTLRLDPSQRVLAVHRGKPGADGEVKFVRSDTASLRKAWRKAETAARKRGLVAVAADG